MSTLNFAGDPVHMADKDFPERPAACKSVDSFATTASSFIEVEETRRKPDDVEMGRSVIGNRENRLTPKTEKSRKHLMLRTHIPTLLLPNEGRLPHWGLWGKLSGYRENGTISRNEKLRATNCMIFPPPPLTPQKKAVGKNRK